MKEALAAYNKAVELEPRSPQVYLSRGYTYDSLNQIKNAIADYSYAIRLDPQFVEGYLHRREHI